MTTREGLPAPPGRVAYAALLGTSTLGTLSSNIMNAPINRIAGDLDATDSQLVLAVSTFTVAMVLFAPLAGWLSQRYGAKQYLLASLGVMVLGQVGAALSTELWFLVAMRGVQGLACSAIPPAIQQTLYTFWAHRRGRAMAAWASAVGLGQAVGPPLGGLITETTSWRGVFILPAVLSLMAVGLIAAFVPAVRPGRPPMHATGMVLLIAGVGSLVMAFTLAGQGGPLLGEAALVIAGLVLVVGYAAVSRGNPRALVAPRLLMEVRYVRSTAAATASMAALGTAVVTVPLYLGGERAMGPGLIGLVVSSLAVTMTLFAPFSSRIAERSTPRRVLQMGLGTLVAGPLLLALASSTTQGDAEIAAICAALVLIGCGIAATQSTAALGLMRSPAAAYGSALGIHNMMRFTGLAGGYAWVAVTYPHGNLLLVYSGTAALALGSLVLTLIGPPAPPATERSRTA